MASFLHPQIGKVTGLQAEACTQYRGIQYATLADRFSVAELAKYDGTGIAATAYGPQVVGHPGAIDHEFGFIQHQLVKPDFPGVSDVNGLTLNVTVPDAAPSATDKKIGLPVVVYLHGGGFGVGGNWYPQYDFCRLAKLSTEAGSPIIGININYRLGALGFLTCPELRAAGYKPNNGLRDQRVALRWIKTYIRGFGGDPENITVIGESAGGVSAAMLLLSEEPLAKRIISLGGCPPLIGQVPMQAADGMAKATLEYLGLANVPSSELVKSLLETPIEAFWEKIPPSSPTLTTIDGDIVPYELNLDSYKDFDSVYPGSKWVDSVILGFSSQDASILATMVLMGSPKAGLADALRSSATKVLHDHPSFLKSLLEHYSLSESQVQKLGEDESFNNVVQFINDAAFFAPAIEMAAMSSKDSYMLLFNEPNPWDGPWKGKTSHVLDVAFLFQNFNEFLDEQQKTTAETFGKDVIAFANGRPPWKAFNRGKHGLSVYANGKREYVEPPEESVTGQSPFLILEAKKESGPGLQRLMQVVNHFMAS